ncbi:DNA-protecting protein DprA [Candidatus Microgenomates bacterium]|nr:DNA-protecting protein DprA [Candidatus Microgenomates bacterium]
MTRSQPPVSLDEERHYWVAFSNFPGIGPQRFKLLVDYFGSAKRAWMAPFIDFQKLGLSEKIVLDFCDFREKFFPYDYFSSLQKKGIKALSLLDKDYPELLKQISAPPPVLYFKGEFKPEDNLSLAVVGTRKVTTYGREVTMVLVNNLVAAGLTIVSGLARGVDTIAHQTALSAGGRTIAVLGSGVENIYPPENKELAFRISQKGAVVSEFPPDCPPVPQNFPIRNRIISGLSLGVLVTEAASESGSLITASDAAEHGREVFAVPGPITSPMSVGTAQLIQKGAKLVHTVKDVLEELNLKQRASQFTAKQIIAENPQEEKILEILKNGPAHIDELIRRSELQASQVGSLLGLAEIKGKIKNLGGGQYSLAS